MKTRKLVNLRSFPLFSSVSYLTFFILYAPIALVIAYSFNVNRTAQIWTGFSTKWYLDVLTNDDIFKAVKNSLIVALPATILATTLALAATLGLQRMGRKGNIVSIILLGAPLIIPEIVLAVGSLCFFLFIGLPIGFIGLIVAHTAFCIPFAMLPIRARLVSLEASSFEAAADLGANEWNIFKRVTLPLLAPGVLAGALLAFAISFDDFITSFFVSGPGSTTLPVYIFGMIRSNVTPAINALSTMLLIGTGGILFMAYALNQDRKK